MAHHRRQAASICAAWAALAAMWCQPAAAESSLRSGAGPISASAHLDFRVTVLPSLSLALRADGAVVRANEGRVYLVGEAAQGGTRAFAVPRGVRVTDEVLERDRLAGSALVTIASP